MASKISLDDLDKLMSAEDNDDVSLWSYDVTGEELEFDGWIRKLISVFSDKKESLPRRKNALYAIQTMWDSAFKLDKNFAISKELIEALCVLIWTDIHHKTGELAQWATPILLTRIEGLFRQKRMQ